MKSLCVHCQVKAMSEIHGWLPVCGTKCAAVVDALPPKQRQRLIDAKRKAENPKGNKPKKTKESSSAEIPEETPKLVRTLKLKRNCQIIFYYTAVEDFQIELGRYVDGKTVIYYVGYHIHYGSGNKLTRTLRAISKDYRAFVRGKPSPIPMPEAVPFEQVIPSQEEPILLTTSDDEDLFGDDTSSSDEDLFGSEQEYDLPVYEPESEEKEVELEDIIFSEDEQEDVVIPETPTPPVIPATPPPIVPSTPSPKPIVPKDVTKKKVPKTRKQRIEKLIRRAKTEFAKDTKTLNVILSLIEMSKKYRLLPNSYAMTQKLSLMKYDWSKKKTLEFFKENSNAKAMIWTIKHGKGTKLDEAILTGLYDVIFESVSIDVPNVDRFIEVYPNAFNVKTTLSNDERISINYLMKSAEHQIFFTQFISASNQKTLSKVDVKCFANRIGLPKKIMKTILKEAEIIRDDTQIENVKLPMKLFSGELFQNLSMTKTSFSIVGNNVPFTTQNHRESSLRLYYSQIRPFLRNPSENFQLDDRFANLMQKFLIELAPTTSVFSYLIEVLVSFQSEILDYNFAQWLLHSLYKKVNKYAITVKTRLNVDTIPNGILVQKNVSLSDELIVTLYDVEPFFKRTIWNALKRIAEMKVPHFEPKSPDTQQFIQKMKYVVKTYFRSWITPLLNIQKLETNALLAMEPPFIIEIDSIVNVNLEESNLAHIEYVDPEGSINIPTWAV